MTTLAGRKIRRYREAQSPKVTRVQLGERFGVSFSTVQGWEEDGKVPKGRTLYLVVASGIVEHGDWFMLAACPRCERPAELRDECGAAHCPLVEASAAA